MEHYPALPHGPIQQIFDGIWFVKGACKMPILMPMRISRTMTIVRGEQPDELVLINSMRLSEAGLAQLDTLGKVTHVLRIAGFHGRDDGFYRERYGAKVHAIEGQAYHRSMDTKKTGANYLEPDTWLDEQSPLPIPGATLKVMRSPQPPEGLLLLRDQGGVLVTGDTLQNTPAPDEFVNFPAKLMMKKMGFYVPHQVGPAWLQYATPSADEVHAILDLDFQHVLPGHGDPVLGEAKAKYAPSVNGPLKGCHA